MWDVRGCDLRLCDICDFFIAHINPSVASWGSAEELVTINREKKPIFLSIEGGKSKTPLWEMGKFPHKYMYDSVQDIIDTVRAIDAGVIKMNSDRWKLLKKTHRNPISVSKDLIYLACPYMHKDEAVKVARVEKATEISAKMMAEGKYVFSPITHCHPMAMKASLPGDWAFWEGYDRRMIACCNKIVVLKLDGWEQSTGVQAEIKIGEEMGIPVEYIDP
jgi:hypothetical protein